MSRGGVIMARYQRYPTVVEAIQVTKQENWGHLGVLSTGDWIIFTSDNSIYTMDNTTFQAKYFEVSPFTPLTGDDWN